jgi:ParB family chromosome partitioning protein
MAQIIDYKDIPLTDLVIGKAQVRLSETSIDIEELAASIEKQGLLEPIVVAPAETEGKFQIILGQRRFLAHQHLKKDTIKAGVLDEPVDEVQAKVLSLTENLVRRDLNRKDLIDVCTALYKKYGSIVDVHKDTGLPKSQVSEYVKYDRLIPELKQLVDNEGVKVKTALRAQDAAMAGTLGALEFDKDEAIKLAKEMTSMSDAQQKKIKDEIKQDPSIPVDEVIERAKSGSKITQIVVTLGENIHGSLSTYARDEETTLDDAAASLIETALSSKGYLETANS